MHKVAYFNGKFVAAEDVKISGLSAASLYGSGIFTTVAIHNAEPFLWEKHRRRLQNNAAQIGLDLSDIPFEDLEAALRELIHRNSIETGRARITLFDDTPSSIWTSDEAAVTTVSIITSDQLERPDILRLTISPFLLNSRSPLAGVKSCNYLEKLLALEEAQKRGFDEAIRPNERGEITSACMANLFWQKEGQLFTPSLETGCLPGTTREYIFENFNSREVRVTTDDLFDADGAFICSAGLGLKRISSLDDRVFELVDHEILHLLPFSKTRQRPL